MKIDVRQKITIFLTTLAFATLAPPAIAEPAPLIMSDFAYGAELAESQSELTRFSLKPAMIKNIKRNDLADLRIFDGNNELTPRLVRKKDGANKIKRETLTFSRLRAADNTTAYVLDRTENHERSLKSLSLHWKKGSAPNMLLIRVEHSADKKSWKTLRESEAVNNFKYEGTVLKQNIIDINEHTQRYIKIAFLTKRKPPALASVHTYTTNKKVSDYSWIPAGKLQTQEGMTNAYRFKLSEGVRPELFKLSFPKLNSILNGVLNTVETVNGKLQYKPVFKYFNAYVVTLNNKVVKSRPVNLSRWKASDWLITANVSKNIQPEALPSLTLAYPQYEVVFANTGVAPYTVVWGNPTASKPITGDIIEHVKNQQNIAEIKSGSTLNNTELTELMESRQTPWLMIAISLVITIIAAIAFVFGYRRYQLGKE